MTREEAIKFLNSGCLMLACEYHIGNNRCGDDFDVKENRMNEALTMAIADMEKQIPKKPKENIIGVYCPECRYFLSGTGHYCEHCGQALDWSEEND